MDSEWRKSTRSGSNGACVEARHVGNTIQVRDSTNRSGPTLNFDGRAWLAFLSSLK
ncbi:DUF397 domain-containing protein [Micromonospora arborensis]|uniref:DUF397 domain-containing protein n=1 Tax=Micromonospora arborensis TaxID=2116518 RepID=A0A318NL00_9ACTN|nr:DUF397 domain-containing protein [Micromonospora arborensis]PYC71949.1 DUF397 domain-containing protein [Micromonospora arborensis]